MKKIAINLNDSTYSTLCVRGDANKRTPEMEAAAILHSVCHDGAYLPIIKNIEEIIHGESGVAVYTYIPLWKKSFFLDNKANTGYTGDWILASYYLPVLEGRTVVIYNAQLGNVVELIYKARMTGFDQCSDDSRRYKIHFENWKIMGTTRSMWKEFAKTGSNPVKYFYRGKA